MLPRNQSQLGIGAELVRRKLSPLSSAVSRTTLHASLRRRRKRTQSMTGYGPCADFAGRNANTYRQWTATATRIRRNLHLAEFGRVFGGVSIFDSEISKQFPNHSYRSNQLSCRQLWIRISPFYASQSSPLLHYELAELTNSVRPDRS